MGLTDDDGPDVKEEEQQDVCSLLKREDEWEDMVWNALCKAVQGVESMTGERGRHDPLVVRLVESLIDCRVMQATVYPVDEEIGKANEEGKLYEVVKRERRLVESVVELRVSANLSDKGHSREYRHARHGAHGLLNLQPYLVFQVFRMCEGGVVEYEEV